MEQYIDVSKNRQYGRPGGEQLAESATCDASMYRYCQAPYTFSHHDAMARALLNFSTVFTSTNIKKVLERTL